MDEQLNQDQQEQQQEAGATSGEGVASAAATTSTSGTQSSAANASQGDGTAADQSSGEAGEPVGGEPETRPLETKTYADGSSATGYGLPDVSPIDNTTPVVSTDTAGELGNASTLGAFDGSGAEQSPNGRHPAHRWIDLAEMKLAAIEHAAVAELLDIMRNLRQEL